MNINWYILFKNKAKLFVFFIPYDKNFENFYKKGNISLQSHVVVQFKNKLILLEEKKNSILKTFLSPKELFIDLSRRIPQC